MLDVLVGEGLLGVLEGEVDSVALLAGREVLALIDIEELYLLQQVALGLVGYGLHLEEADLLVDEQCEVAAHGGILAYLGEADLVLAALAHKGLPVEVGIVDLILQLNKLEDVVQVIELKDGESVVRELVLVKVKVDIKERQEIISMANVFRANIVDVSPDSLMIELTGNNGKIQAFINLLEGFHIEELVRTGLTGLTRGIN